MSRDYRLYLEDIITCCRKIRRYTAKISSVEDFVENEVVYDAVLRNFGIIGEAMGQLPGEIRDRHPEVEWSRIRLFRNIITHRYFSLNNALIWNAIQEQVTDLENQIGEVLEIENRRAVDPEGCDGDSETR